MNVCVVRGFLSRSPEERVLPSGDRMVSLEVSVRRPNHAAESVPVSWPEAPKNVVLLEPGTEVMVLGRVRRRFFRAGGFTQSRTEVVAERVVPCKHPKKTANLLARAAERLTQEAAA